MELACTIGQKSIIEGEEKDLICARLCSCQYLGQYSIHKTVEVFSVNLPPCVRRKTLALDLASYPLIPEPQIVLCNAFQISEFNLKSSFYEPPGHVQLQIQR